jgi:ProP effector
MTISNDQINAVVARLAAAIPQTFVLEKHLAHRPLKIGIAADLRAALPELPSRVLARALAAYAKRIMYLQALTAGAPRVDLAGNPAGEVTALEAGYASSVLASIMALREISPHRKKTGEVPIGAPPKQPASVIAPARSAPAGVVLVAAKGLKHKPVLHLGNAAKAKLPPGAQPT